MFFKNLIELISNLEIPNLGILLHPLVNSFVAVFSKTKDDVGLFCEQLSGHYFILVKGPFQTKECRLYVCYIKLKQWVLCNRPKILQIALPKGAISCLYLVKTQALVEFWAPFWKVVLFYSQKLCRDFNAGDLSRCFKSMSPLEQKRFSCVYQICERILKTLQSFSEHKCYR